MEGKISLAMEIYFSKRILAPTDSNSKRIYKVLLNSYIRQCIIKREDNIILSFDGKFIESKEERLKDWFVFIKHKCYEVFLKTFTPNDDKTWLKYQLIHYGADKPIYIKVSNCPNESILYNILAKHGFKVINEHMYSVKSEYEIARI